MSQELRLYTPGGFPEASSQSLDHQSPSGRVIRSRSPLRNLGQLLCESACSAPAGPGGKGGKAFDMGTGTEVEQLDVSSSSQEKETSPDLGGTGWGSQKKVASFSIWWVA